MIGRMRSSLLLAIGATALLTCGQAKAAYFVFNTLEDPNDTAGYTAATGVNATTVVGFYNFPADTNGFSYNISSATYSPVTVGGAAMTAASGISSSGEVAGTAYYAPPTTHGFTSTGSPTVFTDDPSGPAATTANGVNASGTVVGSYFNGSTTVGYVTTSPISSGTFTSIFVPSTVSPTVIATQALGINNSNTIVGTYTDNTGQHGFVKSGGTYTGLDVPGSFSTVATGIDSAGDVVGYYTDGAGEHGFVDDGGTFTTIDDPNGIGATLVLGVNDLSQVVGLFTASNGETFGFLATEMPEPGTLALFGLPIMGMVVLHRRRALARA